MIAVPRNMGPLGLRELGAELEEGAAGTKARDTPERGGCPRGRKGYSKECVRDGNKGRDRVQGGGSSALGGWGG